MRIVDHFRSEILRHHELSFPLPVSLPRRRGRRMKKGLSMRRNTKNLYNFKPPATDEEIHASSLQFVRKLSGFNRWPSKANEEAFNRAVAEVAHAARHPIEALVTTAPPRDREVEAEKARARSAPSFALPTAQDPPVQREAAPTPGDAVAVAGWRQDHPRRAAARPYIEGQRLILTGVAAALILVWVLSDHVLQASSCWAGLAAFGAYSPASRAGLARAAGAPRTTPTIAPGRRRVQWARAVGRQPVGGRVLSFLVVPEPRIPAFSGSPAARRRGLRPGNARRLPPRLSRLPRCSSRQPPSVTGRAPTRCTGARRWRPSSPSFCSSTSRASSRTASVEQARPAWRWPATQPRASERQPRGRARQSREITLPRRGQPRPAPATARAQPVRGPAQRNQADPMDRARLVAPYRCRHRLA